MHTSLLKTRKWSRRRPHKTCAWRGFDSEVGVIGGGCNDQSLSTGVGGLSLCFIVSVYSLYSWLGHGVEVGVLHDPSSQSGWK